MTIEANNEYATSVGIMPTSGPVVVFNGIVKEKQSNSFSQMFAMAVHDQPLITSLIERKLLTDNTKNTHKVIMKSVGSVPGRYNRAVLAPSESNPYEDDTSYHVIPRFIDVSRLLDFPYVHKAESTTVKSMSYFMLADFSMEQVCLSGVVLLSSLEC